MNKQKEEDFIRKIFNKPKVREALQHAYMDTLVIGDTDININKIIAEQMKEAQDD